MKQKLTQISFIFSRRDWCRGQPSSFCSFVRRNVGSANSLHGCRSHTECSSSVEANRPAWIWNWVRHPYLAGRKNNFEFFAKKEFFCGQKILTRILWSKTSLSRVGHANGPWFCYPRLDTSHVYRVINNGLEWYRITSCMHYSKYPAQNRWMSQHLRSSLLSLCKFARSISKKDVQCVLFAQLLFSSSQRWNQKPPSWRQESEWLNKTLQSQFVWSEIKMAGTS